jgi:hypothetical protein
VTVLCGRAVYPGRTVQYNPTAPDIYDSCTVYSCKQSSIAEEQRKNNCRNRNLRIYISMYDGIARNCRMVSYVVIDRFEVRGREARPTAAAVAAWLVAGTGERGKNPLIPSV